MGNLRGFFSSANTPEVHTETHKSLFFTYKQVSGRIGDNEWLKKTNAFILCDLVWTVQKSHAINSEGSFNVSKGSSLNKWWPGYNNHGNKN